VASWWWRKTLIVFRLYCRTCMAVHPNESWHDSSQNVMLMGEWVTQSWYQRNCWDSNLASNFGGPISAGRSNLLFELCSMIFLTWKEVNIIRSPSYIFWNMSSKKRKTLTYLIQTSLLYRRNKYRKIYVIVSSSSNSSGNRILLLALGVGSIYVTELKAGVTYVKTSGKANVWTFSWFWTTWKI